MAESSSSSHPPSFFASMLPVCLWVPTQRRHVGPYPATLHAATMLHPLGHYARKAAAALRRSPSDSLSATSFVRSPSRGGWSRTGARPPPPSLAHAAPPIADQSLLSGDRAAVPAIAMLLSVEDRRLRTVVVQSPATATVRVVGPLPAVPDQAAKPPWVASWRATSYLGMRVAPTTHRRRRAVPSARNQLAHCLPCSLLCFKVKRRTSV